MILTIIYISQLYSLQPKNSRAIPEKWLILQIVIFFLIVLSYVDKREINTYDLYISFFFCSESVSSLLQYRTQRGKEDSSIFLAYHPCDILKSKQVNILVTYCSWMKRLFQRWICSRTHRLSLHIFKQTV